MSKQSSRLQPQWRQIEGRNPVLEALRSATQVTRVALEEGIRFDERIQEIARLAKKQEVELVRPSKKSLRKRSQTQAHQGVIAWAEWPEEPTVAQILYQAEQHRKDPFFLLIPKLTYEQNLGAIMRTGEAAGVDAVVIGNRSLTLSAVVSRVSMGATEYLPLIHDNIFAARRVLQAAGVRLVAADMEGEVPLYKADLRGSLAIVVGDEHKGISQTLAERVDLRVRIPMQGKINSLNVSVATGVILYEAVRQRQNP